MNLESPKVTVEKSAQYQFDALCDVKNYEKLMPENIAKFEVTSEDSFIFGLSGMPVWVPSNGRLRKFFYETEKPN